MDQSLFLKDLGHFQKVTDNTAFPRVEGEEASGAESLHMAPGLLQPTSRSPTSTGSLLFNVVCVMVPWSRFISILKLLMQFYED